MSDQLIPKPKDSKVPERIEPEEDAGPQIGDWYWVKECLTSYEVGGMDFDSIDDFDGWLCKPENLNRLLPFPRTLVAFRVRYATKDRGDFPTNIFEAFIRLKIEEANKLTFFYIRNGEQVYRLSTDLEFGDTIFPDRDEFPDGEKLYGEVGFHGEIKSFISEVEYEHKLQVYFEYLKELRKWKQERRQWIEDHPDEDIDFHNPLHWTNEPGRYYHEDPRRKYKPFDPYSVHYDDCMKKLQQEIQYYNRIVLIIQGLFDRSPILHPHPPVKTWDPQGMDQAIKLVYQDRGLYNGEKPDFEAYWDELNKQLTLGSITIGQRDAWHKREIKRAEERDRSRWSEHKRYSPRWKDPGPGKLAKIEEWKPRARRAIFRWTREREWVTEYHHSFDDMVFKRVKKKRKKSKPRQRKA